jgi:hypothetical protein
MAKAEPAEASRNAVVMNADSAMVARRRLIARP